MSGFKGDMTIEEYLARLRREEAHREQRASNRIIHIHQRRESMSFGRSSRDISTSKKIWGAYLVNGKYYVSTWTDLPHSDTDAIQTFYALDKRDALIKGAKIIEAHAAEQAKLPESQRVKTIPRKPYQYEAHGYGDGFSG